MAHLKKILDGSNFEEAASCTVIERWSTLLRSLRWLQLGLYEKNREERCASCCQASFKVREQGTWLPESQWESVGLTKNVVDEKNKDSSGVQ
jgi:hypothetical protein